jgi:hypothetical protein
LSPNGNRRPAPRRVAEPGARKFQRGLGNNLVQSNQIFHQA